MPLPIPELRAHSRSLGLLGVPIRFSVRWLPAEVLAVLGFMGTGSRLRRASLARNHQSPADFITDRFRSQLLRYTIVTLQVVQALVARCIILEHT